MKQNSKKNIKKTSSQTPVSEKCDISGAKKTQENKPFSTLSASTTIFKSIYGDCDDRRDEKVLTFSTSTKIHTLREQYEAGSYESKYVVPYEGADEKTAEQILNAGIKKSTQCAQDTIDELGKRMAFFGNKKPPDRNCPLFFNTTDYQSAFIPPEERKALKTFLTSNCESYNGEWSVSRYPLSSDNSRILNSSCPINARTELVHAAYSLAVAGGVIAILSGFLCLVTLAYNLVINLRRSNDFSENDERSPLAKYQYPTHAGENKKNVEWLISIYQEKERNNLKESDKLRAQKKESPLDDATKEASLEEIKIFIETAYPKYSITLKKYITELRNLNHDYFSTLSDNEELSKCGILSDIACIPCAIEGNDLALYDLFELSKWIGIDGKGNKHLTNSPQTIYLRTISPNHTVKNEYEEAIQKKETAENPMVSIQIRD